MSLYALNLFDLANKDPYRQYSKRSVAAVNKHGGKVVALGRLAGSAESDGAEHEDLRRIFQESGLR